MRLWMWLFGSLILFLLVPAAGWAAKPAPEQAVRLIETDINSRETKSSWNSVQASHLGQEPLIPTRILRRLTARYLLRSGQDIEFANWLLGSLRITDFSYSGTDSWWYMDGIAVSEFNGKILTIIIDEDTN